MGSDPGFTPQQLQLYLEIDELLWSAWKPLGAWKIEGGRDAYYAYVPEVLKLALAGDAEAVAAHLHWAAQELGLKSTLDVQRPIAETILAATRAAGLAKD